MASVIEAPSLAAPPSRNNSTQPPPPISETYNLCLSFTRDGLTKRVPWVFVLYLTDDPKGTRIRAKDASDHTDLYSRKMNSSDPAPPTGNHTYRFMAREEAYVDNYSCHGRVVLKVGMTKDERDEVLRTVENTQLSDIVGLRDCQKWAIECLRGLGFEEDFCELWEVAKGENVYVIERAVRAWRGSPRLGFLRGPGYKLEKERKGRAGGDQE